MARNTCLDCVRKHIAQAMILMDEAALGYPFHRWYAAGHLAEAESESRAKHPQLAQRIREARLAIMAGGSDSVDFDQMILTVCALDDPNGSDLALDPGNSKQFGGLAVLPEAATLDVARG